MAAVLLMAGCVKEEISHNGNDGKVQVTFTANLPIEASRALVGDGSKVNELNYAIYDDAGELFASYPYQDDVEVIDNHATVTLDLVKGQSYKIAFWAQHSDAPYTFDRQNGEVTVDYSGTVLSNDEKFDAFYVLEPITVTGPDVKTVILRRPFAQINLGATKADVDAAKALGIVIDKTKVTLSGVNQTLELFSGKAKDKTTAVVNFDYNALPGNDLTVNSVDYAYLAANYILANGDADVTELEFVVRQGSDDINTVKVPAVNYKRNHRTNILGRLLTSSVDFNIVIDGDPYGDLELSAEAQLAMAALTDGEYTLAEDLVLTAPIEIKEGVNFKLNLNGKTLSFSKDMYADANGDPVKENVIVNNGTLEITGGTISSLGVNGGSAIYNAGTLKVSDATLTGAPCDDNVKVNGVYWASYAVNHYGESLTFDNVEVVSNHGAIALYGDAVFNDCNVTLNGRGGSAHVFYVGGDGTEVVINSGVYTHNGNTDGSLGYIMTGATVTVNGGTFTASNGGYGFATYTGALNINGGTFNSMPINWGGPISIKGGTFVSNPNANFIADGYKAMQKDGKWTVVPADVDAIVATDAELDAALQSGSDTIVLSAGTYVIPDSAKGKTLTIKGTGNPEDVVIAAQNDGAAEGQCDYSFDGSNVTFDGVTITSPGTYFPGYARMKGTYNNCIINGVWTTYDNSSFNGCTFNVSGNNYNLWTWGAAEVNLNDCTFNCEGKAVLLYGTANTKLTVNDSTFNDNGDDTVTGKAAIEIGNDYNKSYTLVVNNSVVNGFAVNPDGFVTGTTLWANKNSMPADKLKVTVDGQNAYKVAVADPELAALFNNAAAGSTVVLTAGKDYGTVAVNELKDVTIDGNGSVMIFKTNATSKIEDVTINNVKFEYTGATADCGVVIDAAAQIENLVVEGCTFKGTGAKAGRGFSGLNNNATLVIKNCTFEDLGYPIYAWGGYEALTVEECTFKNIKSWAIMPQSGFDGDLTVNKCNFVDCLGGGLVKAGTLTAGHTFTFTNNTVNGCTIAGDHNWFQFNTSAGTLVLSGNTKDGQPWTPGVAEGLK